MKSQFLRLALLGVVSLSVVACAEMQTASTGGDEQTAYQAALKQAEEAYKKVTAVEGAWSTTEDRFKAAKEAAAKADFKTALSQAKRAKFESDMAYEQFESQKKAGPHLF